MPSPGTKLLAVTIISEQPKFLTGSATLKGYSLRNCGIGNCWLHFFDAPDPNFTPFMKDSSPVHSVQISPNLVAESDYLGWVFNAGIWVAALSDQPGIGSAGSETSVQRTFFDLKRLSGKNALG